MQNPTHPDPSLSGVERRLAPRLSSNGEVVLRPFASSLLQGEMMDISPGGFRMKYLGKRMRIGAEVEVIQPWSNVKATLAWTIRSGEWIHAGFQFTGPGQQIGETGATTDLMDPVADGQLQTLSKFTRENPGSPAARGGGRPKPDPRSA